MDNFLALTENTYEFVEQKSRFIAFSYYCFDNFKLLLKNLKNKYPNATHICYAYRILDANAFIDKKINIVENFSDDKEPSQTAGAPILNALKKQNVVNSAIFVVRYFGGVKLGTGGLISAYRMAAESVCNGVNKYSIFSGYSAKASYENFNYIKSLEQSGKVVIENIKYDTNITFDLYLKDKNIITERLKECIINEKSIKIFEEK